MDAMNRALEYAGLVELTEEAKEVVGGGLSSSPLGLALIIVVCAKVDKASPTL